LIVHKRILAVNENGTRFGSRWSVTHTPSGYSTYSFGTKWQAKLFKQKISFLDWTPVDVIPTLSFEQKQYVTKVRDIISNFNTQKDYKSFSDWPTL
jgi:hypothetical protein